MSPLAGGYDSVPEGKTSYGNEAVSTPAFRLEARPALGGPRPILRRLKFLAQIFHVDVEDIAPRERIEIPYLIEEFLAGEDFARTAQKAFEERVLLQGEGHLLFPDVYPAGSGVYRERP